MFKTILQDPLSILYGLAEIGRFRNNPLMRIIFKRAYKVGGRYFPPFLVEFVYSTLFYMLFSHTGVMWHMLLQFNIHIVSLFGIIVGVLGWSLGRGLRTLVGKRENTRHERGTQSDLCELDQN